MRIGETKESKFLKKEDVGIGKLFTIRSYERANVAQEGKPQQMKWIVYFKEAEKGFVANWTNRQLIAKAVGTDEMDDWTGKQVVLYDDPSVTYGGELTGGIRCRAPKNTQSGNVPTQSGHDERNPPPFSDDIPF